jgi:hypothetical protein
MDKTKFGALKEKELSEFHMSWRAILSDFLDRTSPPL